MKTRSFQRPLQILLIISSALILLTALGSGLARVGLQMDPLSQNWILIHGPLMICGFLGTLISLERAVALASRYPLAYAIPASSAVGAVLLLIDPSSQLARAIFALSSAGLMILFTLMLRLHPSKDVWIMSAGVLCYLIGTTLWFTGEPIWDVVHLWIAFLILTIVGERLELSRVRRLKPYMEVMLITSILVFFVGSLLTMFDLSLGIRIAGVGAILMAAWLLRYDVARRTIMQQGLARYIAACLIIGYIWMGFAGIIAIWKGAVYAGPDYAIILHAYLLGFVVSMIFGHMPIILPAVSGLALKYTPLLYIPLLLLHSSLFLRILADLTGNTPLRQWAALFNVTAILVFMVLAVVSIIRGNRKRFPTPVLVNKPAISTQRSPE